MTEPRLITLPTRDAGDVTLPEPSWCIGHGDHDPETFKVDVCHDGPKTVFKLDGVTVGEALVSQAPFAARGVREIQGFLFLRYGEDYGRDPAQLYDFAAALDGHADQIREFADQLAALLAEGDR
ncbi:hypothetical protein [Streptomyces sp. NPDC046909]|uniref:DUF6907 domain-containing protein n=1 Tax=Streptomyces sp. NPDC046909 TaxID=3155617 RepID=UPI0033FE2ECE